MMDIEIEDLRPEHHEQILALAELLPQWFDDKARGRYIPLDLKLHRGYVACLENRLMGFVTFTSKNSTGTISWIGVHPEHHRQSIGRQLIQMAEQRLISLGFKKISVETVGWSDPEYVPYEKTRAFYRGVGYHLSKKLETGEEAGYRWQMHEFSKRLV